jgi:hypothetical protein
MFNLNAAVFANETVYVSDFIEYPTKMISFGSLGLIRGTSDNTKRNVRLFLGNGTVTRLFSTREVGKEVVDFIKDHGLPIIIHGVTLKDTCFPKNCNQPVLASFTYLEEE